MTKQQSKKLNKAKTIDDLAVERYQVDAKVGLTADQVQLRIDDGLVNIDNSRKSKSIGGIIVSNLITFFNIVYLLITILLVANGKWKQCTYLPVVVVNTAIAIVPANNIEANSLIISEHKNFETNAKRQIKHS